MEKIKIKITQKDLSLRNEMHFNAQQTYKAQVFKSKKGKGSYNRKNKYEYKYTF